VVGGSDGLGAAFAAELAGRGLDLVLVARRRAVLDEVAGRLRDAHGVAVRTLTLDAVAPDAAAEIARGTDDLDVGLVVCNAARSPTADFLALTPGDVDGVLDLNCRLAAHLAHHFGTRMAGRGNGGIVLLSSIAGFQGTARVALYAATKAYLRVLAEGLWAEYASLGVDVVASCPGRVHTPTFERSEPSAPGRLAPPVMAPEPVVRETLAALGRKPVVIPGRSNRLAAFVTQRLLPRRSAVTLASAATRSMYPSSPSSSSPSSSSPSSSSPSSRTGSRRPARPGGEGG
jgi:short-subunit dehydrogenase